MSGERGFPGDRTARLCSPVASRRGKMMWNLLSTLLRKRSDTIQPVDVEKEPWNPPIFRGKYNCYRFSSSREIFITHVENGVAEKYRLEPPSPELNRIVGRGRIRVGAPYEGKFMINEWGRVLVNYDGAIWRVGEYSGSLNFVGPRGLLTSSAPSSLQPGSPWPGPRIGMRYALAVSGADVYCRLVLGEGIAKKVMLTKVNSNATYAIHRWGKIRPRGGNLFINAARELFTRTSEEDFTYVGHAPADKWFPRPA